MGASADGTSPLEELPLDQPICLYFGNEKEGISKDAKKACDLLFHIPMFVMVESYNLSVAAAITLYDYLRRKRGQLQRNGDLSSAQVLAKKAHFYVKSLGIARAKAVLKRGNATLNLVD